MSTRSEFIKQMMLLSGSAGLAWTIPESIKRAVSIDPRSGSSFLDAEHVVVLMQENRSFDHCFGTLQGVRGYNDPRAITQPDGNTVWAQTSKSSGHTYAPFRFDINDTKITWMGSIPHTRHSQIDAWNSNKYDDWIDAKRSGHLQYADMPLTMGHYTRDDLPFNHAMADAFTICDQNFSSAISPTRPNRLFFWSGTNRGQKSGDVKAYIRNNFDYGDPQWKLFPEWLEENDISWRVYQNDISTGGGFEGEERSWLGNFGCNPLEWFTQYNVRFAPRYIQGLRNQVQTLPGQIKELQAKLKSKSSSNTKQEKVRQAIANKKRVLKKAKVGLDKWSGQQFDKLPQKQKALYRQAFTTNSDDPNFHKLTSLRYQHNGNHHELPIPKGDILYQFRKDVKNGNLPTVSWLTAPQNFSDHPSAPWYGAWYTSEILDILTENPEVWKKTVFIFTYDENDGYFDHIPPFTAPNPADGKTGKCSPGIDVSGVEWIHRENEIQEGVAKKRARSGPVGLGFRVPMIIASPWSRGGRVCSEVFDHTSVLQFLEHFVNERYNKQIQVTNISDWRRTVTGDLTSAFRPDKEGEKQHLQFLERDLHIKKIHDAKFKKVPSDYKKLSDEEIKQINRDPASSPHMPRQESGVRPSCALPYELYTEGRLTKDKKAIQLAFEARNDIFGEGAAGAPFKVYAPEGYLTPESQENETRDYEAARAWDYAVSAGEGLTDTYPLDAFKSDQYLLRVYGPNGFYRELAGTKNDPPIGITCDYQRSQGSQTQLTGNVELLITNRSNRTQKVQIIDNAYGNKPLAKKIPASGRKALALKLDDSYGWYDFTVRVNSDDVFIRQYAGRVETGAERYSDPAMGQASIQ